jgi:hypothetical protein
MEVRRQLQCQRRRECLNAEYLTTTGAIKVCVVRRCTAWAGIKAPGTVFARDSVRQRLLDQPVERAVQGNPIERNGGSQSFGDLQVRQCALGIEQGGEYAGAGGGNAPVRMANQLVGIHRYISAYPSLFRNRVAYRRGAVDAQAEPAWHLSEFSGRAECERYQPCQHGKYDGNAFQTTGPAV